MFIAFCILNDRANQMIVINQCLLKLKCLPFYCTMLYTILVHYHEFSTGDQENQKAWFDQPFFERSAHQFSSNYSTNSMYITTRSVL